MVETLFSFDLEENGMLLISHLCHTSEKNLHENQFILINLIEERRR